MIVSTIPAVLQFFVMEPVSALELAPAVWAYAIVMATFSTVFPVFLQAEALKRIGASQFALIGAVGPVSTVVVSAVGLEEPLTGLQAVGGLLVVGGVLLVSLKRS
jgi:drug/metabolite transporter (DMT)-like permease